MMSKDYSIAFQDDQVLTYGGSLHHVLGCRRIGSLSVPSGELIARDPFVTGSGTVFDQRVPPGDYPVFATSAYNDLGHDIAFAAVRCTHTEPVRWEPAHGTDEQGRAYGYAVDSATGSFMDRTTSERLDRLLLEDDQWPARLYELRRGRPWSECTLPREPDANLFLFFLNGDGGYPSYYGYDAGGALACVVTDFLGLGRQEISSWPATLPPIPAGFDARFYAWLGDVNGFLQFPGGWDHMRALPQEDLHYLEQSQAVPLPDHLRLHYQSAGSWLEGTEPLQEWWPRVETQARAALETTLPIFPVLRDWESVAVCDHHAYVVYEPYERWKGRELDIEYLDLKTHLLNVVMRDLGSLDRSR